MAIPTRPIAADRNPAYNITPIQGTPVVLTSGVTLTTPTSAALITGLTQSVPIAPRTTYLLVVVKGKNATVTAAATITLGCYSGATSGALTTLLGTTVVVAPTGGTTVAVDTMFLVPITPSQWNTSIFISIAATASTGNFVLNAGSTEPTTLMAVEF
jgi:hypothetical protein